MKQGLNENISHYCYACRKGEYNRDKFYCEPQPQRQSISDQVSAGQTTRTVLIGKFLGVG